jgi:hypothetical protein
MKQKTETKIKTPKFPKNLGACLGELSRIMRETEKLSAKLKPLEDAEAALREHLLTTFKKTELNGAKGSGVSIALYQMTVPTLEDFDAFMAYASKKANWDLLNRKVSSEAWRARVESGKKVPGVKAFDRLSLRVTKA